MILSTDDGKFIRADLALFFYCYSNPSYDEWSIMFCFNNREVSYGKFNSFDEAMIEANDIGKALNNI